MKSKSKFGLRLNKSMISNLNEVVAGLPPVPPGSNSCVQEETCLTCDVFTITCLVHTCKACM
ncbi:hypothetical protein [Kordia sp.]|uniref:hypothetical protein n=1 Tax=Kordia sp. TaxID=1965332 RepID=UPI0025BE5DEA|nr:hypothetical protein [Kordia sp.]MCH2195191.1 hypothetical protein [Kordia sp.]